jgi:hypothetical protein
MRCSKCILPDSIPGISFDETNECNYCRENFPSYYPKGAENLAALLHANKTNDSAADCLVGLSGGKDSTYALIALQEEFKMRVEAFTYVHEGTTGFSLENARNTCKRFNIKHHIVSLGNQQHLKTFTGFFKAWLKSPSATTAGMTCVACKHLHILGMNIAKERNIPMVVWSTSPLEYSPFLALKYAGEKNNQYKREGNSKGVILLVKALVKTTEFPGTFFSHFNLCLKGCLAAFPTSSYLKNRYPEITPVFFYEYIDWNADVILNYIKENAGWKIPGEKEDWHSDCLFNFFKEYMFLSMLGVSYTDAFLSNQIRHGLLSRDEAMRKLIESKHSNAVGIYEAMDVLGISYLSGKINNEVFACSEK